MSNAYRILVINGGGVRGIVPASIIKQLVDQSHKPIHELFDYIIGTSIGGIIATALTVKDSEGNLLYTPDDVLDLFSKESSVIFPTDTIGHYWGIRCVYPMLYAKYARTGIDMLLEKKLGNATFLDTKIPITTVSYSLYQEGPRVWSTYKAMISPNKYHYYLKDAAGATSAAPTFFPPKITHAPNGEIYHDIDGGIFANSPTLVGMSVFQKAHPEVDYKKIIVVSLGTGQFEDKPPYESAATECSECSQLVNAMLYVLGSFVTFKFLPTLSSYSWLAKATTATIISAIGIEALRFSSNYLATDDWWGALPWVFSHDIISKMMGGSEKSDVIESLALFNTMRINPILDKNFKPMDKGNPEHIQNFSSYIDMFINTHQTLLNDTIDCLNSRNVQSNECFRVRFAASNEFGQEFHYTDLDVLIDPL